MLAGMLVSDIAVFAMKKDDKLEPTNQPTSWHALIRERTSQWDR